MKKTIILLSAMWLCIGMASAYDFSHTYQGKMLYYTINSDNTTVSVVAPVNSSYYGYVTGDVEIPESVSNNGVTYGVTEISYHAFEQCVLLTSITIPNTVTIIRGNAFEGCVGLDSVVIPGSVTAIEYSAFRFCSNLSTVVISNSLTSIGSWAFHGCTSLTTIALPNSLSSIDLEAFAESGLTSVTIPGSVSDIGSDVFFGCNELTSIVVDAANTHYDSRNNCNAIIQTDLGILVQGCNATVIPDNIRAIGGSAFSGFNGIASVNIPDSVVSIGDYAFSNCGSLKSVTFGESVASIGQYAFGSGSTKLTSIHCKSSNPPVLNENVFQFEGHLDYSDYTWHYDMEIFIPCGSLEAYQSAQYWSSWLDLYRYENIFVTDGRGVGHGTVNVVQATCDNPVATLTANPEAGYLFDRWSDGSQENPRTLVLTKDTQIFAYFVADENTCPTITTFPWNNTFNSNLTCWDAIDADGDGYNWLYYDGIVVSESYSYFDGSNSGLTPDNWLISRKIHLPENANATLSWAVQSMNTAFFNEHYSVYVSTGGNNIDDFTLIYQQTLNTSEVVNLTKNLSAYRGQTIRIAFRHHNTENVFVLGLGNIKITVSTQDIEDVEDGIFNVHAEFGQIVVETDQTEEVEVYDVVGHKVDGGRKKLFSVPTSGVYMVKMGNHPARKVVVNR